MQNLPGSISFFSLFANGKIRHLAITFVKKYLTLRFQFPSVLLFRDVFAFKAIDVFEIAN